MKIEGQLELFHVDVVLTQYLYDKKRSQSGMYRGGQTRGVSWRGRWRSCMRICMGIYPHVLTVVMTSPSPVVYLIDVYLNVCLTVYASHRRASRRRASHIGVHLIGVHLIGVHLIGVHLIGVHFLGVHLKGLHLIGVHLHACIS